MATAAILVALFTTMTAALLPHQVPLKPVAVCPACDPRVPVIPANMRNEASYEQSVGSAGDGGTPLRFVPLIGIAIGALRGHLRYYRPAATPPEGIPQAV